VKYFSKVFNTTLLYGAMKIWAMKQKIDNSKGHL